MADNQLNQVFTASVELGATQGHLDNLTNLFAKQAAALELFSIQASKFDGGRLDLTLKTLVEGFEALELVLRLGASANLNNIIGLAQFKAKAIEIGSALEALKVKQLEAAAAQEELNKKLNAPVTPPPTLIPGTTTIPSSTPPPPPPPFSPLPPDGTNAIISATERLIVTRRELIKVETDVTTALGIVTGALNNKLIALDAVTKATSQLVTQRIRLIVREERAVVAIKAVTDALLDQAAVIAAAPSVVPLVPPVVPTTPTPTPVTSPGGSVDFNVLATQFKALQDAITKLSTAPVVPPDSSEKLRTIKKELESILTIKQAIETAGGSRGEILDVNRSKAEIEKLLARPDTFRKFDATGKDAGELARFAAIGTAFDAATAGATRLQGKLGELQELFTILIAARDRLGAAALEQDARDAAIAQRQADRDARQAERDAKKAQRLLNETLAKQKAADEAVRQAIRNSQASDVGDILNARSIPQTPIPAFNLAALEIPIKGLQALIRSGGVNVDALLESIKSLNTGAPSFDNLSLAAERLLKGLIGAENAVRRLGDTTGNNLKNQTLVATAAMDQLRAAFTVLTNAGPIDAIDAKIAQLGIAIRNSNIDLARFQDLLKAAQSAGGASALGGGANKDELQVISLIRRIEELNAKSQAGAKASTDKQAEYNKAIAAAQPALQALIDKLSKDFKPITDPNKILTLQNIINSLFNDIGRGKVTVDQLNKAFEDLSKKSTITPPILPPGAGGEAQAQILRLIQLFQDLKKGSDDTGKSLLLNFGSIARIFQVQVLHQALGQFLSDMRQSVDQATKFQIKISEIRTLSQENQLTTGQWAAGLRNLSDSFGLPILDVTKAAYDAISNQVTRGAQTFEFLRTTLEFAKVTVSSAADAQNLLSSAVKSYGENNLTAGRAAEVLFNLIDVGRVTASELANTFGRVAQLGAQAGISLQELSAALATLTVRGVKPNEAMTLLNNVVLKLIQPSDEMKKLFQQWGVASGEAAIATFGFVGVLRLLQQEFDKGGISRLGELEKNIRAVRGALGLVSGDAFSDFEANLAKISNGADKFDKATEIIKESAGAQLQKELVRIQNLLNFDIGQNFLQSVLNLTAPFGGLAKIVESLTTLVAQFLNGIKTLIQPLAQLTAALTTLVPGGTLEALRSVINLGVAYVGTLAIMRTATLLLGATISTAIAGPLGIVAVALTGIGFLYVENATASDRFTEALKRQSEGIKEVRKQSEAQAREREQQKAVDDFKSTTAQSVQSINQSLAASTAQISRFLAGLHEVNRVGVGDLGQQISAVFTDIKKRTPDIQEFFRNIQTELEKSEKRVIGFGSRDQGRAFEQSLFGLTDTRQTPLIIAQFQNVRNQIIELFNKPFKTTFGVTFQAEILGVTRDITTTFKNAAEAQAELDALVTVGKGKTVEAIAIREKLANLKLITPETIEQAKKDFDEIDKLLERHITQLGNAISAQKKTIADLTVKAETKDFERSLAGLSGVNQAILTINRVTALRGQAVSLFNNGELEESRKKFEEIDKLLEKVFDRQKSFREKAAALGVVFTTPLEGGPIDQLLKRNEQDRLGLERGRLGTLQSQQQSLSALQRKNTADAMAVEKAYGAIQRDRIQEAIAAQKIYNDLVRIGRDLATGTLNINNAQAQAIADRKNAQNTINSSIQAGLDATKDISDNIPKLGLLPASGEFVKGVTDSKIALDNLKNALEVLQINPGRTQIDEFLERLNTAKIKLENLNEAQGGGAERQATVTAFFERQIQLAKEIAAARDKQATAESQIKDANAAQAELQGRIRDFNANPAVKDALANNPVTIAAAATEGLKTFAEKLQTQLENISKGLDDFVTILKKIPDLTGNPIIPQRRLGGPFGTDTSLIWGSPDEFIVNAESSRRFAPQLRSINMGFEPRFNSSSSSTNVNIGDLNVNVTGSSPTATTREFWSQVKREIRRGNIKL